MNEMRRVCVVITARPSYARIKSVLEALRDCPTVELQLVLAASALLDKYGRLVEILEADGFEPAATVYMLVEGENLVTSAKSTGIGIIELATLFDRLTPNIVVSIADRYETIATAIAASYLNIPVCHVQGGEVTGSIDEKVRHAVTKLSNLHCVASAAAAERVIAMGEDPQAVHVTGCPSIDLAARIASEDPDSWNVNQIIGPAGVGHRFDPSNGYAIVMQHPVTTRFDEAENDILATIHAMSEFELPLFWFWPNVDAGSDAVSKALRRFREQNDPDRIYFLKNLPPEDFLRMVRRARCLIGNSSVGIRECSFLGVPVVNIGDRQAGRERGPNVVDTPAESEAILAAAHHQAGNGSYETCALYGDGEAGARIGHLLATAPLLCDKRIAY